MTIDRAISEAREQKPNPFSDGQLKLWLSDADGELFIYRKGFEEFKDEVFEGYGADTPGETVLLADPPHDALYIDWLKAKIDMGMEEYELFNISAELFNEGLASYTRHIVRSMTPLQNVTIRWPRL